MRDPRKKVLDALGADLQLATEVAGEFPSRQGHEDQSNAEVAVGQMRAAGGHEHVASGLSHHGVLVALEHGVKAIADDAGGGVVAVSPGVEVNA